MKILPAEEKLINLLTRVVWWFEVNWNKGTNFVFFFFCFYLPVVGLMVWLLLFKLDLQSSHTLTYYCVKLILLPIIYGCITTLVPIVFVIFHMWATNGIIVFKETKASPNRNRQNGWLGFTRIAVTISLFVSVYACRYSGVEVSEVLSNLFSNFSLDIFLILSCYTLFVEKIPPKEKEKRKALKTSSKITTPELVTG